MGDYAFTLRILNADRPRIQLCRAAPANLCALMVLRWYGRPNLSGEGGSLAVRAVSDLETCRSETVLEAVAGIEPT